MARLQQLAGLNLPVMLMYLPVHFFFAMWVSSFTFLPLKAAAAGWAAFLVPYYVITSLGEPHHTGGSGLRVLGMRLHGDAAAVSIHWCSVGSVQAAHDGFHGVVW